MKRNRMKVHQGSHPAKDTRTFEEKVRDMDNYIARCVSSKYMTYQGAIEYRERKMAKYEKDRKDEDKPLATRQ